MSKINLQGDKEFFAHILQSGFHQIRQRKVNDKKTRECSMMKASTWRNKDGRKIAVFD